MSRAPTESDLRLAAAGDRDAFQRLVIRSHAALRAAVARRIPTGLLRRTDPDDVLQQAYVAAFKALAEQVPAAPAAGCPTCGACRRAPQTAAVGRRG